MSGQQAIYIQERRGKKEIARNVDQKIETFAIENSLRDTLRNENLVRSIHTLVEYATKAIHMGSLYANFILFSKLVDTDKAVSH